MFSKLVNSREYIKVVVSLNSTQFWFRLTKSSMKLSKICSFNIIVYQVTVITVNSKSIYRILPHSEYRDGNCLKLLVITELTIL